MKKSLILAAGLFLATAASVLAGDAKATFASDCAKCHGAEGKGDTKMGQKLGIKDLTDAKVQASFTDDEAFKALKEGLKDKDGKLQMKPAEGLTDDELKGLAQYVRTLKK